VAAGVNLGLRRIEMVPVVICCLRSVCCLRKVRSAIFSAISGERRVSVGGTGLVSFGVR